MFVEMDFLSEMCYNEIQSLWHDILLKNLFALSFLGLYVRYFNGMGCSKGHGKKCIVVIESRITIPSLGHSKIVLY
jgi:hypothetical protein